MIIIYISYDKICNMKDIKKFDPYEILEISPSDELPTIKRAYR
jgi:preprotein translocase subunit Sec63